MENQNQQTQPSQSPSQMPSISNASNKSKMVPIILGIAVVIIIAIGAYALGTKQSQPQVQNIAQATPIPSPTPDPTANWKTYTEPNNLFIFKYPQDFTVTVAGKNVEVIFPNSYKGSSYTYNNDVNSAHISFGTGIINKLGFLGDFCKIPIVGTPDAKEVKVNNLSYIKSSNGDAASGGFYGANTIYAISHNGNCYEIVLTVATQGPGAGSNNGRGPLPQDYAPSGSKDKFISILDEVVSSFKFTD